MRWMNLLPLALGLLGGITAFAGCGSDPSPDTTDAGPPGPGFGNDGGSTDGNAVCSTTTKKAEKVPLDMVIALDTSFSMDFDGKWIHVKDAMKSFVGNPAYAELGVGLQFFPIRKQCSVADYAIPAVALDLQPTVAPAIDQALDAQQMAGGTPMVQVLLGVSGYLKTIAKPDRRPVVVLATDGIPDDTCAGGSSDSPPNTLDNAVAAAKAAYEGTPSIATFVIGVGSELTALDAIAAAGGTTKATLVDTSTNAQAAFLAALDAIRKAAIPCDYGIPDGLVDVTKTNVTYTPANGQTQTFGFVGDASGCDKAPTTGWYFDDPTNPKKVVLCGGTCDIVKGDDQGRVDVVFGCPRNDVH
jgi:hypothetical protein